MTTTPAPITITTETHADIGAHITYATTTAGHRTIELDRHDIGDYGAHLSIDDERRVIHEATITHYGQTMHDMTQYRAGSASTRVTPTARALTLITLKTQAVETDPAILRGQTIVAQIRAERARRRAQAQARAARQGPTAGLLTDPARSIFA